MDFSDSFFHDTFRADASVTIPDLGCKAELSATSFSELVPSGISSSFDALDWPDSFRDLERGSTPESLAVAGTSMDTQRFSPTKFFFDDSSGVSLAEALTSQATFSFDLDMSVPETKGAASTDLARTSASRTDTITNSTASSLCDAVSEIIKNSPAVTMATGVTTPGGDVDTPTSGVAGLLPRRAASDFKTVDDFKAYKVRREKNNEASRRSRTKFRQKAREMEEEVHDLRQQNTNLKKQLSAMTAAFEALRQQSPSGVASSDSSV